MGGLSQIQPTAIPGMCRIVRLAAMARELWLAGRKTKVSPVSPRYFVAGQRGQLSCEHMGWHALRPLEKGLMLLPYLSTDVVGISLQLESDVYGFQAMPSWTCWHRHILRMAIYLFLAHLPCPFHETFPRFFFSTHGRIPHRRLTLIPTQRTPEKKPVLTRSTACLAYVRSTRHTVFELPNREEQSTAPRRTCRAGRRCAITISEFKHNRHQVYSQKASSKFTPRN